jgi:beta-lactamase class A
MKTRMVRGSAVMTATLAISPTLAMAASPGAGSPPRNATLEARLKAVIAPVAGTFGISVEHVERGESAAVNADERFQMASVFKVPVLIELFNQARAGRVSLDTRVEWADPQRFFGSGILNGLRPGLNPTLHDLAFLMITLSDNAATDILCQTVGFDNVNARLKTLGATHTSVTLGTRDLILWAAGLRGPQYARLKRGDDLEAAAPLAERQSGQRSFLTECPNCTTPADMTLVFEKLIKGEAADPDSTREMLAILGRQQFNQRLPRLLPDGVNVAHKTGSLGFPVWVINDAGIVDLPDGGHVIVSVFSHGPAGVELSDDASKRATTAAETTIAEIARTVWDFYTTASAAR